MIRLMVLKNIVNEFIDRLLIAQAIVEELSIISKDKQFKKYKPTVIWDI